MSAGLLSGVVGVGGGIIIIPSFMLFIGLDQHHARTSLAVMFSPIGILAAINYHKSDERLEICYDYCCFLLVAILVLVGQQQ